MLLETMEQVRLVVPMNIGGAELLLENLSQNLVIEIQQNGTVNEELLAW